MVSLDDRCLLQLIWGATAWRVKRITFVQLAAIKPLGGNCLSLRREFRSQRERRGDQHTATEAIKANELSGSGVKQVQQPVSANQRQRVRSARRLSFVFSRETKSRVTCHDRALYYVKATRKCHEPNVGNASRTTTCTAHLTLQLIDDDHGQIIDNCLIK